MSNVQDIPLNKLTASSRNVRRTNPAEGVEELAASILAHGLLQNLTVIPAAKAKAKGGYEVIAGGRRLAALKLLAKEKKLDKDAPIPCAVMAEGIAEEISLAENAMQCPMHPADQFEAFFTLHRDHGMAAEDIAARFGVTAAAVRQRLKLAAVSPKLMALYRAEEMNLDALTAFAISDDHTRQEQVWEDLPDWKRDREGILAALTEENVPATDPRAIFVGLEAYEQAGGTILRDLFDPEGGGFLTDADLLNRLAREKLEAEAATLRAEGWKWIEVMTEYDHGFTADLQRTWPEFAELSDEDQAHLDQLEEEHDEIANAGEEGDEADVELTRVEAEIDRIRGPERFRPEDIARGGAIVCIARNGTLRFERGYIRPEDAAAEPDNEAPDTVPLPAEKEPAGLSEKLVAELTASRTLALRNALAESPQTALTALVHALAAETFFHRAESASTLQVRVTEEYLSRHAPGVEETPQGIAAESRHEGWAKRMPAEPNDLWAFVAGLEADERLALLAHCVSLGVNAVEESRRSQSRAAADTLASTLRLDMATVWQPTAANYLGRVSKERILEAVREGVSEKAAKSLESMKKQAMAKAAEKVLSGTGWLPPPLRGA